MKHDAGGKYFYFLIVQIVLAALFNRIAYPDSILGKRPNYMRLASVSSVPNRQAIGTRIWVPGLDEGYVPQGMTFAEGEILVSLYQSTDVRISSGPSRVYRVDPNTGGITGQFDLPADVGHADGLAYTGNNVFYLADTKGKQIYKIDLAKALSRGNCNEAVLSKIKVNKNMGPAFITYDGKRIWFGQHTKSKSEKPKIFQLTPDDFFKEWPTVNNVASNMASLNFDIEVESQGATFDKEGYLWLSQSSSKRGKVQKIDPSNGKVLKEYELMAGIEDLAFAPDGRIWSVSEAGAKRWLQWETSYPLIFEIDMTKLK
jgi:hypothetical protein